MCLWREVCRVSGFERVGIEGEPKWVGLFEVSEWRCVEYGLGLRLKLRLRLRSGIADDVVIAARSGDTGRW